MGSSIATLSLLPLCLQVIESLILVCRVWGVSVHSFEASVYKMARGGGGGGGSDVQLASLERGRGRRWVVDSGRAPVYGRRQLTHKEGNDIIRLFGVLLPS